MATVVNLRQARKAARRDAQRKAGDENAARHGQSRAERHGQADSADRAAVRLDGHRVERGGEDET